MNQISGEAMFVELVAVEIPQVVVADSVGRHMVDGLSFAKSLLALEWQRRVILLQDQVQVTSQSFDEAQPGPRYDSLP